MRDNSIVPSHIAIIMDGNGRWARKRLLPNAAGHKKGAAALELAIEGCAKRGVKYLTVYALSTENLKRPRDEVDSLMGLFMESLQNKVSDLKKNGIRLRFIGDRSFLNQAIQDVMSDAEKSTINCSTLTVIVAICYGARAEITRAVQNISAKVLGGDIEISNITANTIEENLYTFDIPDPDMLIRPGGEKRISNYLLWQCAYTELIFTDTLWPDFNEDDLNDALEEYKKRERRYGKLTSQ